MFFVFALLFVLIFKTPSVNAQQTSAGGTPSSNSNSSLYKPVSWLDQQVMAGQGAVNYVAADHPTLTQAAVSAVGVGQILTGNPASMLSGQQTIANSGTTAKSLAGNITTTPEQVYCFKAPMDVSVPGCIAIGSYEVLYLTSWVLFVAAMAFDWTIQWSLSMYDIINSFKAIQYGWETLRNVINLFFILILVYIAIATILRIENYGYEKLLSKLVIAAFLINFSMFFTKIIIDASNITAIVFYKQIMVDAKIAGSAGSSGAAGSATASASQNNYLSLGIMNALGLQSVWGVVNNTKNPTGTTGTTPAAGNNPAVTAGNSIATAAGSKPITDPWIMTLVGLGGSVFVLILSFVFFATTIMLLLRIVVLILLIITSPAAFAARVLPQTSKWSDKWWSQLTSNALFAPVYMILMFVTLKMVWGGNDRVGNNLLVLFTSTDGSGIQVIVFFILLCAMLIACLTVAASFGTLGAKTVSGWGKSLGGKAKDWTKNYAKSKAFAPVGWAADKASKSAFLSRLPGGGMLLQGADKLAQAKVGGSSYRSRIEADKKTYKARGELIKKANTEEIVREIGEKEEDFQRRKKGAIAIGINAQQKYFGVDENGLKKSEPFFKNKRLAAEDFLEAAGIKKGDPVGKAIARSNTNLEKIINGGELKSSLLALGDSEKTEIEALIKATRSFKTDASGAVVYDQDSTIKNMTPEKVFKVTEKLNEHLEKHYENMSKLNKDMAEEAVKMKTASSLGARETAKNNLMALTYQVDAKTREIGAIKNVVTKLESEANKVQDIKIQSNTRDAIEKNKPEPAAK